MYLRGYQPARRQSRRRFGTAPFFKKGSRLTYYCHALIQIGVLTVGDLFDVAGSPNPRLLRKVGPTSISRALGIGDASVCWSIPSVWMGAWGK